MNQAADELSRVRPLAGEWRLHPQTVQLIWDQFGDAQVDLFASHDSSHCDLFYSLTEGTLGTDALAHSWPRGLRKYAFPPVSLLAQTLRKIREDEEQVILVAPYWPNRTWFSELVLLATAPPWPIPLRKDLLSQGRGTLWHPRPDLWNLHVWLLDGTRQWNLFVNWCSSKHQEPTKCPISVVLSFLQEGLERRLSPSTLKVYVAAIAAHHEAVDGKSLGRHDLIVRFLRGARRLNPPRPPFVPSWDLSVVLTALQSAPFEPLQSVELKFLSMKTALLVALASIKRVGDLQAFSVDEACLEFGPANSHVILRPRLGYVPKVPTTPFRDQVVNLQALPLEEADPALALLCPVRALRAYVDRTRCFRTSDQLFVCHGGKLKGKALSKQRLSHWIVDTIALAYQQQGRPCPLGVKAHSTRSPVLDSAQVSSLARHSSPRTGYVRYSLSSSSCSCVFHLSPSPVLIVVPALQFSTSSTSWLPVPAPSLFLHYHLHHLFTREDRAVLSIPVLPSAFTGLSTIITQPASDLHS
ncbi:hypothetical protein PO909_000690 [Leuciscus waleckii]